MKRSKPIICSGCGKKRVPFLGSRGRPTKRCKECKSGSFWTSSFGQWFLGAAERQSPDSMPHDDNDIKALYELWKRRRAYQGTRYVVERVWDSGKDFYGESKLIEYGQWETTYSYQLCHLDPVTGEGFQGRLTAKNLILAPAKVNQSLGNNQETDHGHRVYTNKPHFKNHQEIKAWCTKAYDIAAIANELKLKPKSKEEPQGDLWLGKAAVDPAELLIEEVNRLGAAWYSNHVKNPYAAFEDFLKLGINGSDYIEQRYGEYIDWEALYDEF
ncbi:TPA: hypothetical protein ACVO3A_004077 [Vibrio diabolicus]